MLNVAAGDLMKCVWECELAEEGEANKTGKRRLERVMLRKIIDFCMEEWVKNRQTGVSVDADDPFEPASEYEETMREDVDKAVTKTTTVVCVRARNKMNV